MINLLSKVGTNSGKKRPFGGTSGYTKGTPLSPAKIRASKGYLIKYIDIDIYIHTYPYKWVWEGVCPVPVPIFPREAA